GLDTTNWVFNMTVYLSITFFNICLYCYLKFKTDGKVHFLILSLITFYLAHIAAPNRMTGFFVFIFLLELFWLYQNFTIKNVKKSFLAVSIFLLAFLFISKTIAFPDSKGTIFSGGIINIVNNVNKMQQLFAEGHTDFLFYPVLTVGKILIPDTSPFLSGNILITLFFIFLFSGLFLLQTIKCYSTGRYLKLTLLALLCVLASAIIYQNNKTTLSASSANLILIGLYTLLIASAIFLYNLKKDKASTTIFIALSWTFLSFIFSWLISPDMVMATSHRYLIVSAEGIALMLATIISLGKTTKKQLLLFSTILILIVIHIQESQKYIGNLLSYHNQQTSNKIWSAVPSIPEAVNSKQPLVVYLENDGTNGTILHDSLGFGLDYHIALLYNIQNPKKIPAIMDNWQNVISAVTDGKSFAPYFDRPLKPVPIDNIYAFRLEGQDNLINITSTAREKLSIIKQ
ncbi:MAG: hypothetical protein M1308_06875, partial [Actinobacteria bacterium]|nr:hypothetical protein [Actinomycetota bacterium]